MSECLIQLLVCVYFLIQVMTFQKYNFDSPAMPFVVHCDALSMFVAMFVTLECRRRRYRRHCQQRQFYSIHSKNLQELDAGFAHA